MTPQSPFTPLDRQFMTAAFEQAQLAVAQHDHPFGAVITLNDQLIGAGKSQDSSGGTVVEHAEINALITACHQLGHNDLRQATIYTTSEPCPMCAAAIFQAKIPRVNIGLLRTDLPDFLRQRQIRVFDLAQDSGYPITIRSGLMKPELLAYFQNWLATNN